MEKAVILDFMGVVADFDCLKLILDTPLKDKLTSGRLVFRLSNMHELKNIFKRYKSGEIDQTELTKQLCGNDKKLSVLIPSILHKIPDYITPNESVIQHIRELKNSGVKIIILSNTIPETEYVIKKLKLEDLCDDIICSTHVGVTKPDLKIFDYVVKKHQLDTSHTIYIDDSKKNLQSAEKFGIETFLVKNSGETDSLLDDYQFYIDFINSCESENCIFY